MDSLFDIPSERDEALLRFKKDRGRAFQRHIMDVQADAHGGDELSLDGAFVAPVYWGQANDFISKYEWLGSCHRGGYIGYGLRSKDTTLMGVAAFGRGPGPHEGAFCGPKWKPHIIGLLRGACSHRAPKNAASFLISRACRFAYEQHGMRGFYAYADESAGEIGNIYQALNWIYIGVSATKRATFYDPEGRPVTERTATRFGVTRTNAEKKGWRTEAEAAKHKYVHFEGTKRERRELREALLFDALPYPKRASLSHAQEANL